MLSASPQAGGGTELAPQLIGVLNDSIQSEYYALFTYTKVLVDFGAVQPFDNVRDAEARHVDSVGRMFSKRGLEIPVSVWNESNVPAFTHLRDACQAAKEIELANVAMYEGFLLLELPADVDSVFLNLLAASRNQHLPAFQRCLDGSG
jgi:hypothetical protein